MRSAKFAWRLVPLTLLTLMAADVQAGASCLLFPLSCLVPSKKYGDEVAATILSIDESYSSVYTRNMLDHEPDFPKSLDDKRSFYVGFQVGMTRYVAARYDTGLQIGTLFGSYVPKPDKWINKQIKARFRDENLLGYKQAFIVFKTPEGKDWILNIISIMGPDGIEECPPYFGFTAVGHCKPQADIDRAKREEEAMAKLQSEGKKPVWQTRDGEALINNYRNSVVAHAGAQGTTGGGAGAAPGATSTPANAAAAGVQAAVAGAAATAAAVAASPAVSGEAAPSTPAAAAPAPEPATAPTPTSGT